MVLLTDLKANDLTTCALMKRIRYTKYVPDPAGEMSMEDLLSALSDYFLQSGFNDNFWYELPDGEQTLDELRRALEQALLNGEMFDEEMRDRLQQMQMEGELEELIEKLIERMQQEDYISIDQAARSCEAVERRWTGRRRAAAGEVRDHRQEPRLSGIQSAARSAGVAGQVEFWTS